MFRKLTDDYAVAPQILPQTLDALAEAGFRAIICNRPDAEVTPAEDSRAVSRAAEAAGLTFVYNPVAGGMITPENVETQRRALREADGPVLAYCRSGNRSALVWALAMAGDRPTEDILQRVAEAGYDTTALARILSSAG